MTEREKLAILEEVMELDEGELNIDSILNDYAEWDSVAAIAFLGMLYDKFDKTIDNSELKNFVTAGDAIAVMK